MSLFINYDSSVFVGSYFIDKQVVISSGYVVDGGKALIANKNITLIAQVSAYPHIRLTCKSKRKILHCSMEGFKANELVKQALLFKISPIPQYNVYSRCIPFLHF